MRKFQTELKRKRLQMLNKAEDLFDEGEEEAEEAAEG